MKLVKDQRCKRNNLKNSRGALCDLVSFVQLKKCVKHPRRSDTFIKVSGVLESLTGLDRNSYTAATLLEVTLLHGCFSHFLN